MELKRITRLIFAILFLLGISKSNLKANNLTNGMPACENPEIFKKLEEEIESMNKRFARVEHIRKFKILHRDFSIEDGEMTPTLKLKRNVVLKNYANEIESLYH